MEKGKLKIQVVDVATRQVLYECPTDESDKAFEYAAQMEDLGLDVEVISPTLTDSLSNSLGLSKEAQDTFKQSLEDEMESHDGSCCFKDEDKTVH